MTTIRAVDESNFSNDYAYFVEQMQVRSLICLIDFNQLRDGSLIARDVAHTLYAPNNYQVSARGIGYIWAETEAEFIDCCERYNVKFVP
ncbi:MAG: hypothetical protein KME42_14245 [Tildeniella nuda ZEHNDER 1965/U140]|jgi:hypothetical protein|nr:hypothetical protein [Tildeniella nuda ZEHNDER 1965/U140]